jgi:2-dehydropantoate 2-reductase
VKVLVVGAGAVGQVYGRALGRGGADVAYLVKPKHADEARRGFTVYALNKSRAPERWDRFEVLTSLDEVAARSWDAVILTVPTPALREPGWLEALAAKIGTATVVTLQPALDDPDFVRARVPAERVVVGMIGLMAWLAPLPHEPPGQLAPGTAFWIPPFGSCALGGPAAAPIAAVLRRGGLPAAVQGDVESARAFGGATLDAVVAALEHTGWDLGALRRDRALLALLARAAREGAGIAARVRGVRAPRALGLLGPTATRLVLGLLAHLAPVDLGAFFRVHYAKVGEQHRQLLAARSARARDFGIATPALDALQAAP